MGDPLRARHDLSRTAAREPAEVGGELDDRRCPGAAALVAPLLPLDSLLVLVAAIR